MYLVYFTTKNNDRHWKLAQKIEDIEQYVKENNIEEYGITVNDIGYERMKGQIENYERRIEDIKKTLREIEERY